VDEFKERIDAEVRQQEEIDRMWKTKINPKVEEFRRSELLGKYIAKISFG